MDSRAVHLTLVAVCLSIAPTHWQMDKWACANGFRDTCSITGFCCSPGIIKKKKEFNTSVFVTVIHTSPKVHVATSTVHLGWLASIFSEFYKINQLCDLGVFTHPLLLSYFYFRFQFSKNTLYDPGSLIRVQYSKHAIWSEMWIC